MRKRDGGMMKVEWKTCLRVGVSAFVLFLAIYYWQGLTTGFALFMSAAGPLVIGLIIAYILNIPMSFYERHFFPRSNSRFIASIRRVVCMVAAILTLLGVIAAVVRLVIPELTASIRMLISWIPDAIDWVVDFVADSESLAEIIPQEYLDKLAAVDWEEWFSRILSFLGSGIGGAVGTAVGAISSVFSGVVSFVLGLIFAFYLLIGKDRLLNQGSRLMKTYLPNGWRERISHVLTVLNDCFHRYVVGQCMEAVILGTLCIIGMLIFRFPYATMIGTLVGFTALIPVAGAYIGAVVGAIMIMTVSPIQAVLFVVFLTILQQLEGNLIYPRVVGTSLGLPGMWVLAAVTVGGGLMGISGMLIGVPLVAAIYRLLREDVRKREGKERAAASRRHRENRERRHLKEAEKTPKLKKEAKVEVKPKQETKVKPSDPVRKQNVQAKVEKVAGAENKEKQEKPSGSRKKSGTEKTVNSEIKIKTENTSEQEQQGNGATGGGTSSHKRRRRRKKPHKPAEATE